MCRTQPFRVRAFHKPQIVKRLRSPRSCDTIKANRKIVVAEATLFMPEVNSWCEDENCTSRIEDSDLNHSPREVFLCHMHRLNNKSIPCRKIVLKKSPIILTLYCSGRGWGNRLIVRPMSAVFSVHSPICRTEQNCRGACGMNGIDYLADTNAICIFYRGTSAPQYSIPPGCVEPNLFVSELSINHR